MAEVYFYPCVSVQTQMSFNLVKFICFAKMDFSEQSRIEGEPQDTRHE